MSSSSRTDVPKFEDNLPEAFEYYKEWRGDLTNTFTRSTEDPAVTLLRIKNKKYDFVTKVDTCIVNELRKLSWCRHKSDKSKQLYAKHSHNTDAEDYLHRYILIDLYKIPKPPDDGKYYSVDHINHEDTLDNRLSNLHWADQSQQNQNTGKRTRKHNARQLPEGVLEEYMPKFVTYNEETYGNDAKTRSFFRIENHPALSNWSSTKSDKYSPLEKLAQTYEKLNLQLPEAIRHVQVPNLQVLARCTKEDGGEEFVLFKEMVDAYPHVYFQKETEKRGCKFVYEVRDANRKVLTSKQLSSGKKDVSVKRKFEEMQQNYEDIIWA